MDSEYCFFDDLSLAYEIRRVRDVIAGEAAMKRRDYDHIFDRAARHNRQNPFSVLETHGVYLQKSTGMRNDTANGSDRYLDYLHRAPFYPIARRSKEMAVGMLTRIPAVANVPESLLYLMEGRHPKGMSLRNMLIWAGDERISVGRPGILLDASPNGGPNELYAASYPTESIVKHEYSDSRVPGQLVRVVLSEPLPRDAPKEAAAAYRDLILDENGLYAQLTYMVEREGIDPDEQERIDERLFEPTFSGSRIGFIPFCVANGPKCSLDPSPPPMSDLAAIVIDHYRLMADGRHQQHITAHPQAYITEIEKGQEPKAFGAAPWTFTGPAKVGLIEPVGHGAEQRRLEIQDCEVRMAVLGAQMIFGGMNRNETSETARLRNRAETSGLMGVAWDLEAMANELYRFAAVMTGADPESVKIITNKDFIDTPMSPGDLKALVESTIGMMSIGSDASRVAADVLAHRLRYGENLPEDTRNKLEPEQLLPDAPPPQQTTGDPR